DDAYYRVRPRLGLLTDKILKIDNYCGLNGKLTGLKSLFDEGHVAIVHGVGYPNPDRSHFRSTEIWQTGSDSNRNEANGWLGRYFDNCCSGVDPTVGVAIGDEMPQAFSAKSPTGVTFSRRMLAASHRRWRRRQLDLRRSSNCRSNGLTSHSPHCDSNRNPFAKFPWNENANGPDLDNRRHVRLRHDLHRKALAGQ